MSTLLSITWDLDPEIFSLGPIHVRYYGLCFAVGFLVGYNMMEKMFKREFIKPEWLESLFMYVMIATVVGARLGHVFFYAWDYYSQHPWEIIKIWHGGLASHGGTIGILIAIYMYSKKVTHRSMLWTLDRLAVPVALVSCLIRLGNFFNSEIYGHATDLPWGIIFLRNGETVAKHPTQLYEASAYLITFAIMLFIYWKTEKRNRPGFTLGVFFLGIFGSRFLIEFVKENQEAWEAGMLLNMGQLLSIPFILAGIYLVYRAQTKPEVIYPNHEQEIKRAEKLAAKKNK